MQSKEEFFFAHDEIRPVQDKFVKLVERALTEKQDLVVHAPTGLGKTAAVLSPALKFARENKLKIFFLTSRHTQHQIALDTLRKLKMKYDLPLKVASIIGKKWMCLQAGVESLSSGEFSEYCRHLKQHNKCEYYSNYKTGTKVSVQAEKTIKDLQQVIHTTEDVIEESRGGKLCPYEISAELAAQADIIVTDYYYLFHPSIAPHFLAKTKTDLENAIIIVDEGHNLHERVRDLATAKLSNWMIRNALKEAKKFGYKETLGKLVKLQDVLNDFSEGMEIGKEKIIKKEAFIEKIKEIDDYTDLIDELEETAEVIRTTEKRSAIGGIAHFLLEWEKEDEGFVRILSMDQGKRDEVVVLARRCLDPQLISKDIIKQARNTILMSGTLTPVSMYQDLLGFDNAIGHEFKSPFPEHNRLNLVVPRTTTKYSMRSDDQYKQIAHVCAEITDSVPGNSLLFFPGYAIRDKVFMNFKNMSKKTTFLENPLMNKQERMQLLEKFKGYNETGATLLGVAAGSFSEGIDLPGDLVKCVVVVGLPLQKPNLETQSLIDYFDQKFGKGWDYGYLFPAFNKVQQAAGRCIRSATDKGVIVFLDERFVWPMYKRCFSEDNEYEISTDPEENIHMFFSRTK